jgi:hypothetical protein
MPLSQDLPTERQRSALSRDIFGTAENDLSVDAFADPHEGLTMTGISIPTGRELGYDSRREMIDRRGCNNSMTVLAIAISLGGLSYKRNNIA